MSEKLLYLFFSDDKVAKGKDQPNRVWKVVMRTGTWKLRPGPGGVKLKEPLRVLRDKAPAGHISLSALKTNFDAKAKENVTVPTVHADGTTSDSGFVRELRIEDVKDSAGKVVESRLWAGMDITEPDILGKIERKSLVGVSGGVLFGYERTEDAKKFDQILSHVMVTNSPWINGTGDFTKKLPTGVMASEDAEVPTGEVEFEATLLDDPYPEPPPGEQVTSKPAEGTTVWRPEDGFRAVQGKLQKALDDWRRSIMANFPAGTVDYNDFPYLHVDDVTSDGTQRRALVCSGYGDGKDSWVVNFKLDGDDVEIDPFQTWTPAKQEWVAASEDPAPSPRPAPARRLPVASETELQRAQRHDGAALSQDRLQSKTTTPTGGHDMTRLADLLQGVELSDEQRAAIETEEAERASKDKRYAKIESDQRETRVNATLAKLDKLGLGEKDTPGLRKKVRDIILSDDSGTALMFAETTESGARTEGKAMTATEIVESLLEALPRDKDGKLGLSQQARALPDDKKPEEGDPPADNGSKDTRTTAEKASALLSEGGFAAELNIPMKAAS